MVDLLIKNIGVLATPKGNSAKKGKFHGEIEIMKNVSVGIKHGVITFIGDKDVPEGKQEIDASGMLATPGLVDCHTHAVFGGWRQHEMAQKLAGVSYLDILKAGGGILSTVEATRKATEEELFEKASSLLDIMADHGTTSCEIKSGYGLDLETELKQLRVIKRLRDEKGIDIAATFMGAHALPKEFKNDRDGYIKLLCDEMLPEVKRLDLAEFCDIFCETAVFDKEESRRILQRAKDLGFSLKIHADEIDSIGGAELAGDLQTKSAEHLIAASDEGIKVMANSGVIGVLLPSTSFYLDKPYARAKKMQEEGIAIAIASDFNPGSCPCLNLQFAMSLACLKYKLTPCEALTAVTLNAAAAINMADRLGTVEIGKQGDIVLWNSEDLDFLFYRFGNNQVNSIIRKGVVKNVS